MRLPSVLALMLACALVGCGSSGNCHRCPNCDGSGYYPSNGVLHPGATPPGK